MREQLSSKDWQRLSAYLDDQLTTRERNQVEQALRARPDYRQALMELRQNREMLRSLPRRRAPRNFTLTPEMVEQARRPAFLPFIPVLRFSSAIAALLLVVMLVIDMVPGVSMNADNARTAEQPAAEAPMLESAPAGDAGITAFESAPAGEPPIIYWGGPPMIGYANGLGGGGGMGGGDGLGGGGAMVTEALPNVFHPPAPLDPGALKGMGEGTEGQLPAATPAPTISPEELAAVPEIRGAGPILGVPPAAAQGDVQKVVPEVSAAARVEEPATAPGLNLRLAQFGLALVALITGLAAFLLHRKSLR
jgi:hypothetical protein